MVSYMNDSLDWKIVCLEIENDLGSTKESEFLSGLWPSRIIRIPVSNHEIILKHDVQVLLSDLSQISGRIFTVYGSGNYHHYTYGLLKNIADLRLENYTYVHIDQHSDNERIKRRMKFINCANFVYQIKDDAYNKKNNKCARVKCVKYIGCSKILNEIHDEDILNPSQLKNGCVNNLVYALMQDTPSDVYVSMDLDVLLDKEMSTRWPGGKISTSCLLDVLSRLKDTKNIISADALGFYPDAYEFTGWLSFLNKKKKDYNTSLLVYAMIAAILFDEDLSEFRNEHSKLSEKRKLWYKFW